MEALPRARDVAVPRSRRPTVRSRHGPSLDFDRAAAFIGAIPPGRWAAYKDVATAAGNQHGAQAIGDWVRREGDRLPHVYRVLRIDGYVAEGYRPAGADLPRDGAAVCEVLQREGVLIDARGRASKRQCFTAKDWHRTAEDGKRTIT